MAVSALIIFYSLSPFGLAPCEIPRRLERGEAFFIRVSKLLPNLSLVDVFENCEADGNM